VGDDSSKRQSKTSAGRTGLRLWQVFFLALLLVAPAIALLRLGMFGEPLLVVAAVFGVSLVGFVAQWIDKRRAEAEHWRVPEKVLHLLELLGAWPGAFLAQRIFRHKTAKLSYQFVFWLIVAAYEYAAVDALLDWEITLRLKHLIGL
jgi:uncharacterized membrane protein YsdA (DUF1294 family)